MGLRMDAFSVGAVGEPHAGASADPALRSSRTYVHNRPVFVFLLPGNSTGPGYHRHGVYRQSGHSPEAPPPAGTAAGSMHPPSPTAVNGSVPRPGDRIFQTDDTAVCALHTLRSARGPSAPVRRYPLNGARRRGACTMASHFVQACFSPYGPDHPEGAAHQLQLFSGILTRNSAHHHTSGQQEPAGRRRFSSRGSDSGNGLRVRV